MKEMVGNKARFIKTKINEVLKYLIYYFCLRQ